MQPPCRTVDFMIDFHTHILPNLDDGSKSIEESHKMIDQSFGQGVELLMATPHFYPWQEGPEDFIRRRTKAVQSLKRSFSNIWVGAEVAYYDGIDNSPAIELLKIENTNFLLIEMPLTRWTQRMFDSLHAIENKMQARVVLAHLERYISLQKRTAHIDYVCDHFLIQINADYFINRGSQGKALRLVKKNKVDFIGSDCHNLTSRPPNLGEAYQIIEKKLGIKSVKAFNDKQDQYLERGIHYED